MQCKGRSLVAAFCLAVAAAAAVAGTPPGQLAGASSEARELVREIVATGDQEGRPFAVVDKRSAALHVFDGRGRWRGSSPVLLGQARGDRSAPHVGLHAQLGHVPVQERTTPAGRFESEPGRNRQGESVVWVDYAAAFAIHRLRPGASQASRLARLASATPDDKRVSWGCVVVPVKFYVEVVEKMLGRTPGVVYVLPEQGSGRDLLAEREAAAFAGPRLTALGALD